MKDKTGGLAFPEIKTESSRADTNGIIYSKVYFVGGMTLRDWFAGMFLSGGKSLPVADLPKNSDDIAKQCYEMADAMLKQREK